MSGVNFVAYLESVLHLRALARNGGGDSMAAECAKDLMDDCWIEMTQQERRVAGELQAALERRES